VQIRFLPDRAVVRAVALLAALVLAGCAATPSGPARLGLQLPMPALGGSFSVQQHLTVQRGGRIDELDVALEATVESLDMVGLAFGQRVLSMHYDGKEITSWRHPMLPSQLRAQDVLEDLQLTFWPADAIARALPPGWRVEEQGLRRTLYREGEVVATVHYSGTPRWSGTAVLDNKRYQYKLTILSAPDQEKQ
jgi:Protein of unknown function (DUF3261)